MIRIPSATGQRRWGHALGLALALGLLAATAAEAKKFRYSAGPRAPKDTTYTVAELELEPIVRKGGPRVPATNLQVVSLVANTVRSIGGTGVSNVPNSFRRVLIAGTRCQRRAIQSAGASWWRPAA